MTSFVKVSDTMKFSEYADDAMLRLMSARLLILDDLGAERDTEFVSEKVYDIIDSRYRSGKPMVLTTNLTLDEMINAKDVRHGRIYDRILEVCYPLEWVGKSWRKKQAGKRFNEMEKVLGI